EHHVALEHRNVVERDVAWSDRAEAETMAAPADMWRIAIFAIAFGLEHRVDGAADVSHGDTRHGGLDALVHCTHDEIVLVGKLQRRLTEHDGAADLRELAAIARRDLGEDDVAHLELSAGRRLHGAIMRPSAQEKEIVLGTERLHEPLEPDGQLVLAHP